MLHSFSRQRRADSRHSSQNYPLRMLGCNKSEDAVQLPKIPSRGSAGAAFTVRGDSWAGCQLPHKTHLFPQQAFGNSTSTSTMNEEDAESQGTNWGPSWSNGGLHGGKPGSLLNECPKSALRQAGQPSRPPPLSQTLSIKDAGGHQ